MTSAAFLSPCNDCGKTLTELEWQFYTYRCEACEAEWHARLQRWKSGEEDIELDNLFGGKE